MRSAFNAWLRELREHPDDPRSLLARGRNCDRKLLREMEGPNVEVAIEEALNLAKKTVNPPVGTLEPIDLGHIPERIENAAIDAYLDACRKHCEVDDRRRKATDYDLRVLRLRERPMIRAALRAALRQAGLGREKSETTSKETT